MIRVLAILAEAGHGKTSAANYLRDKYDARIVSLATPLKKIAKKLMRFSNEQLYGSQEQKEAVDPRYGFSCREFLQKLGTEGLRDELWPNVHIEKLMRDLAIDDERNEEERVYIVDDCRFPNEAEFFAGPHEDFHSAVIKIVCTDAPKMGGKLGQHASESSIATIPDSILAAKIVGSRAEGLEKMFEKIDQAIETVPKLAPFRRAFSRAT